MPIISHAHTQNQTRLTPEESLAGQLVAHPRVLSHSLRVFCFTKLVIDQLPEHMVNRKQAGDILVAALLHDIGKTTWPKRWFSLPRRLLKPDEWTVMAVHPIQSANNIKALSFGNEEVMHLIEQHHELPGGRGYPLGIEPDTLALILAACDVYTACTEPREYRQRPLSSWAAIQEVARFAPPVILKALQKAVGKGSGL